LVDWAAFAYNVPLILVQLIPFVQVRTYATLKVLGLAVIASLIWAGMGVFCSWRTACRKLLKRLEERRHWTFEALPIDFRLTGESSDLLRVAVSIERRAKLLRVESPHGDLAVEASTAFPIYPEQSYLLVRDLTEQRRGVGRYIVMHELGHATEAASFHANRYLNGIFAVASVVVWSGLTLHWTVQTCILWCVLSSLSIAVRLFLDRAFSSGHLTAEINADRFALANLDPSDLEKTARHLAKRRTDRSLTSWEDQILRDEQSAAIEALRSGKRLNLTRSGFVAQSRRLFSLLLFFYSQNCRRAI
jgi:hypothetical protein